MRSRRLAGLRLASILGAVVVVLLTSAAASGGGSSKGQGHQPPKNTALPTIGGSPVVGQTLTGTTGSWSGPGISFSSQWLRCDSNGLSCIPIAAAGGAQYTAATSDAGAALRLSVTATNQNGATTAVSAPTTSITQSSGGTPPAVAPSGASAPAISGTAQVGVSLASSSGTWNGTTPLTYKRQWRACNASGTACTSITGANGTTYLVGAGDVGHAIDVVVTATNSAGATTATSAATAPVAPASQVTDQPSFPIRAAFYYPWYNEPWTSHYTPSLGWEMSNDPAVQQAHIRAFEYAHLNAGISSWYAPGDPRDTNLKALLAQTVAMGSPVKWCVYYEREAYESLTPSQIASDLAYIRDNLATSPAYLKVNGKFVVFVYSPGQYSGLDGTGEALVKRYLSANALIGNAAYLNLKVFNYYQQTPDQPDSWHQYFPAARESASTATGNQYFSISPGFWGPNDATPQLTRDPVRWQKNVADMVASKADWQLVTTFDEWYESSSVESSPSWASSSGYGTYLDALHTTIPAP
jgi:hypothetical protein